MSKQAASGLFGQDPPKAASVSIKTSGTLMNFGGNPVTPRKREEDVSPLVVALQVCVLSHHS